MNFLLSGLIWDKCCILDKTVNVLICDMRIETKCGKSLKHQRCYFF